MMILAWSLQLLRARACSSRGTTAWFMFNSQVVLNQPTIKTFARVCEPSIPQPDKHFNDDIGNSSLLSACNLRVVLPHQMA